MEAYLAELDGMAHEAPAAPARQPAAARRRAVPLSVSRPGLPRQRTELLRPAQQLSQRGPRPPHRHSDHAVGRGDGRRPAAGLDVVGVGLPGHFVAKASPDGEEVFFDPFHGGRVLTPRSVERLVEQVTGMPFEVNEEALQAVPLGSMTLRMLNNLKGVYLRTEDYLRGTGHRATAAARVPTIHCSTATSARPWCGRGRRDGRSIIYRRI